VNQRQKTILIVIAAIIIAASSITYGALTARQTAVQTPTQTATLTKKELSDRLQTELPTITGVITAAYPKIATDYAVNKGQLFDKGQWFGTILTYKGSDTLNRDTLRVLLEKKDGVWILRTTPPEPILSAKKYPDVPIDILRTINQPVSLP